MDFSQLIAFLVLELRVTRGQVTRSLAQTKPLKGMDLEKTAFAVTYDVASDFIDQCGGRFPCKLFQVVATQGRKRRELTIYNSKYWRNGVEKYSITAGRRKNRKYSSPY